MEIQIITGFMDSGKTTFLNKYLPALSGKTAVIQNEFGVVKLDVQAVQKDISVTELAAGCICCSLAVDFQNGIEEIEKTYEPDRIVIESSGIAKVSDIIKVCWELNEKQKISITEIKVIVLVDVSFYEEAAEGFGEFYLDQIRHAGFVFLSHLDEVETEEKEKIINMIEKENKNAVICSEDWRMMEEKEVLDFVDKAPACEKMSAITNSKIRRENTRQERTIVPLDLRKLEIDLKELK